LVASLVPSNGHIVEVGSLLGLSSWIWAKSAHPSVTVHCIDPWELSGGGGNFNKLAAENSQSFTEQQFLANVKDCPNVRAHRGYSPDDFADWDQPIDLYFEDAVHTNPILWKNLEFWNGRLTPNGILCGHDYNEWFPDVVSGAERLSAARKRKLLVIHSFWLLLPDSLTGSSNARAKRTVAELEALAAKHKPTLPNPLIEQRKVALAKAAALAPFVYEIAIEGAPVELAARQGEEVLVRGTARNTGGHDWPTNFGADAVLEVGAELHIEEAGKVAAARFEVPGRVLASGQSIDFHLSMIAAKGGTGYIMLDLLYRELFWFANRGAEAVKIPIRISAAS